MTPTSLLIALAGVAVLSLAAIRWHRRLLMLLPALVVINGLPLRIGGSQVRVDQLAACLLLVPLVAAIVSGRRRLRLDATTGWLAAILGANVIASLANSPALSYSLVQCANLASAWCIYLLVLNAADAAGDLDALFRGLLWAGSAACAMGIGAFALASAGVSVGGAEVSTSAVQNLTRAFGAYGTMVEPNILGSFSAALLVITMTLMAAGGEYRASNATALVRYTAALSGVALVLSFTRSAWLGAMAGAAFVAVAGGRLLGFDLRRFVKPALLVLAVVVAVLLLPGSTGDFLSFKLQNLVNFASQTAVFRLLTYSLALEQTMQHPLIGSGTYTFAPLVAQGNDFMQYEGWRNLWIGNYLLLALHDTGIVGLVLWIGMLWSVLAGGLRATRRLREQHPALATRTLALTAAVATLLIPFLATTGFSLGYTWLIIGLLGGHARLAHAPARMTASPTRPLPAALPPRPLDAT